jgi:secreted Zn-dependent insulinase-like peptidase
VLGYEGAGSIYRVLQEKNYAQSLSCFIESELNYVSFLNISIELTKEGFKAYDEVVRIVLAYIKMLRSECIHRYIFE